MKNFEDFMEEVQQELDESSLARLAKKTEKGGTAYMSAERGDKSKKENKARTKQLGKDIRGAGLPGPTKVEGQYKEAGQDKPNKEASYAVSSGKMGKKKFKKAVKKLGAKYDQDSVLIQKDKNTDAKLHPTTKAGKDDLKGWDGKVGKMKPGGKGDMQTRIKGKTFTMEETEVTENYGDSKYDPAKLQKELPKGVKYGKETQGKGDHKHRTVEVDGHETDMKIGGAAKGKSSTYSPSWKDGHEKVKKTLSGIDKTVKEIQNTKEKGSDTANRMAKAHDRNVAAAGKKALGDITGKGHTKNVQGKGNKAARRISEDKELQENILNQLTKLASGAAKTARRAVAGEPKKSFMDSITTDNRPASRTTQKAPEFNRDPNINYAERDIDAKTVKRSMDGVT